MEPGPKQYYVIHESIRVEPVSILIDSKNYSRQNQMHQPSPLTLALIQKLYGSLFRPI